MNERLRLNLLGSPRVLLDGKPFNGFATNKAQALLFYLMVTGKPHSRDTLATLLWDGMTDSQAKKNLRTVLPDLRRLLGDHLLLERQTVAFDPISSYWLDIEMLRRTLTPNHTPMDLATRQMAIDLYQGEFLSGFYVHNAPAFDAWVLEQREQIHTQAVSALTALVDEHAQYANYAAALSANRRLLLLEPWSESVHRQQMILLAQTGERAAALAQYETCKQILAAEFNVAPLAETTTLYDQIRTGNIRGHGDKVIARPIDSAPQKPAQKSAQPDTAASDHSLPPVQVDGHNLPQRIKFYGRQSELAHLHKWIGEDGCRLVGIFGIGGQGKTTLAATFVRELTASPQPRPGLKFERIIWQSLLNAPPFAEVVQEWLYILSDQTVTSLPTSLEQQFSQLLDYVRQQRCLLVLDNLESILQADGRGGHYRPGYEPYGQLVQRLVAGKHQSCLLLTSREWPHDLAKLEEDTATVRCLPLAGLPATAGRQMMEERGAIGNPAELATLVQHYSGNPLALKLVAETVQSLFDGNVPAFLEAETLVFDDIRDILDQQFARLTPLERELMVWLTIVREPITYTDLRNLLAQPPAARLVLEAMRSLQRRSLLEKYEAGFGLQNVVLEYITDWLINGIYAELVSEAASLGPFPLLNRYALILAQAKEYVRASQTRLLLQPIAEHLLASLGRKGVEQALQKQLGHLRAVPPAPGYAAANLLHLLLQLGIDLVGYDFSQLYIRQLYLRGVSLPGANFAQADLVGSVFTERLGRIFTLTFSPDGRFLTGGTREGNIHLWRMADQQLMQVFQAHDHAIVDLAFAPHGVATGVVTGGAATSSLLLASAGEDQAVGLWQLAEADRPAAVPGIFGQFLTGHQQTVIRVGFNAANQHLASVDMDGNVRVWALATGELHYQFNCQLPKFRVATFSPDGQLLAIGGSDGSVYLWQLTGGLSLVLAAHTSDVTAIAFSPDGQLLASGGGDGRICLWSLPHGHLQQILDARAGIIPALVFSPNGQTLASGHWDHAMRVWSIPSGQLSHTMVGHTHVIQSVAFSPDGRTLASGGSDQAVRVWDPQIGQPLYTLRGHHSALNAIALSPDGTKLAAVGYDQLLHLWRMHNMHNGTAHRALQGHRGLLHTVAFSPNGRTLVSAGRDAAIHLWDVDSGQLRHKLHGHTPDIYRVVFHPDGSLLASGSADGTVRLWDLRSIERNSTGYSPRDGVLQANAGMAIYTLAFSPDGNILASAGVGQTIRLWDMTQPHRPELVAARKMVPQADEREIVSIAFSPDGTKLAGGGTNLVHLWDLQSGELLMSLHQHIDWVMAVAFSPDGTTLATASEDRTICLWDVARGTLQATLRGHKEGVYSVIFSTDGSAVLSCSADGTIKFWDSQTGECVNTVVVDGPYAGMNITGVTGISEAQKTVLKALGAIEAG